MANPLLPCALMTGYSSVSSRIVSIRLSPNMLNIIPSKELGPE